MLNIRSQRFADDYGGARPIPSFGEAVTSGILIVASWWAAYLVMLGATGFFHQPGLCLPIVGAIGGLGVSLGASLSSPDSETSNNRWTAAGIGAGAGLVCGLMILADAMRLPPERSVGLSYVGFALWRSIVGTYA